MDKSKTGFFKGKKHSEESKLKMSLNGSKLGQFKDEFELPSINLKGKKFNKLTVTNFNGRERDGKGRTYLYWDCLCDCGNKVVILSGRLTSGRTKSCGCYRSESRIGKTRLPDNTSTKNTLFKTYLKGAETRNLSFNLSFEQFLNFLSQDCFYCGKSPSNVVTGRKGNSDYYYNGIDRVDNNIGYIKENCVPCCKICNAAKTNLTIEEFFLFIKNVYEKHLK